MNKKRRHADDAWGVNEMQEKKTVVEIELNAWGWSADDINAVIEKFCAAHEGTRELHIIVKMGSKAV